MIKALTVLYVAYVLTIHIWAIVVLIDYRPTLAALLILDLFIQVVWGAVSALRESDKEQEELERLRLRMRY